MILALCAGYFLVLLDVTIVSVALPSIGAELTTSSTGLAWVVDGYAVPLAALLLSSGAIGDRLGHRRVVLSRFPRIRSRLRRVRSATSALMLVAGRAAQGVAAALTLPGTLALLRTSPRLMNGHVPGWSACGPPSAVRHFPPVPSSGESSHSSSAGRWCSGSTSP